MPFFVGFIIAFVSVCMLSCILYKLPATMERVQAQAIASRQRVQPTQCPTCRTNVTDVARVRLVDPSPCSICADRVADTVLLPCCHGD